MNTVEFYTPKRLAQELGIPYRLVLNAIRSGALQVVEFSPRHRRIHSKSAAAWIQKITK